MNAGKFAHQKLYIELSGNRKKNTCKHKFDLLHIRKASNEILHNTMRLNKRNSTHVAVFKGSHTQTKYENNIVKCPIINSSIDDKCNTVKQSDNCGTNNNCGESRTTSDELLLQHIAILRNQLINNGITPFDEIVPYETGKQNLKNAIIKYDESEIEKWDDFVQNHPEHAIELEKENNLWISKEFQNNKLSFEIQKSIIPELSKNELSLKILESKGISKKLSKRILNNRCISLIYIPKSDIERIHVADLHYKYAFVGLDIIEMRSIYFALPDKFLNDPTNEKNKWLTNFIEKLKTLVTQEENNNLPKHLVRNYAYIETFIDTTDSCTKNKFIDKVVKL
tara:strand:- start:1692 stop:2705 length:1014 start_codon:yes stop_codon:yes gene_type:complete